jgi:hypothetical protein
MKALVNLVLSLFIFTDARQFKSGFGEGVITINQYVFPPQGLVPTDFSSLKKNKAAYFFTYYVKGNKILRKDQQRDTATITKTTTAFEGINLTNTLQVDMVHPHYLIDWNKRLTYTFFKSNGTSQISEKPLKDATMDLFYRIIDSNKTVITSLDTTVTTHILNHRCFKGLAITKSQDSIYFYYTPSSFKVHSPLNNYLPVSFPYEVLSVKASVNWTNKDGKPDMGTCIFQVAEIKEYQLPDSMFILPAKISIRKNVPLEELYSTQ